MIDTRHEVQDLYARYCECICDDALEDWPGFFVEECLYRIVPRINNDRGLPVSLVLAESRGGIVDRLTAIRNTMVFAPRYISHTVTSVRVTGQEGDDLITRSMLTVHQTMSDQPTELLLTARTFDRLRHDDGTLRFAERVVVCDTESLPSTIIYPL
ncbi:aromatic-ring-hydroxylating dioxygenase subunit beta [Actinomadura macra]|uniref:aromatic-ring-hydroxylating dioxygenase subunit beta n=1 Tax=Actinomadura macra TaxID=46164 RepID=UPI00082A4514|nr:aromatic-ring-hydroxylating dioxygenase subunit beta [Actinomadura macra]